VSAMVHGSVSSSVHKSGVFAAGDQESILWNSLLAENFLGKFLS
jgi:hypothetical protein